MDEVNVVVACDENYARHAAVTGRSILDHRPERSRTNIYVLADNLGFAHKEALRESWADADVVFVDLQAVGLPRLPKSSNPGWSRFGQAAWARVCIPNLLPSTCKKALYLDSDTIALGDVGRLFRTDLQGKAVGCVLDVNIPQVSAKKGFVDWQRIVRFDERTPYFNSGVLLMDLDKWREQELTEEIIAAALYRRDVVGLPDQEALNLVLLDNWFELPACWNDQSFETSDLSGFVGARRGRGIAHLSGSVKPWHSRYAGSARGLYLEIAEQTAWAEHLQLQTRSHTTSGLGIAVGL